MGIGDVARVLLASEMGDATVNEEVPHLFTDLALVLELCSSDLSALHANPKFSLEDRIPHGLRTIPRASESSRWESRAGRRRSWGVRRRLVGRGSTARVVS